MSKLQTEVDKSSLPIEDKVRWVHRDPLKIQTNIYIREASSFLTVSALIRIFSTSGISEVVPKNRWCR
ncbi:MAG: hypothetical protein M3288_04645 [Thermoproteota archaeon]|nr:hypothetical protein [Thermoproteota archaeon]